MGSNSVFKRFRRKLCIDQAAGADERLSTCARKEPYLLDPGFWLLAPFFNFSVEKRALPGIVLTPLWRRKLGLKGINGS
jgi:hypothetical protein